MSKLSLSNLEEFCRTCLKRLRSKSSRHPTAYNIFLLPDLNNLMAFTSLDLNEESESSYPKNICKLCYDKLQEFERFRNLALESTKVLYGIVNGAEMEVEAPNITETTVQSKKESTSNYDDQLLWPELEPLLEKSIKTESIDIENTRAQSPQYDMADCDAISTVKNEIDAEYEELNSASYVNNGPGITYASTNDDADDEEYALKNGAANSSSGSLSMLSTSTSRQEKSTSPRKRDRNKTTIICPRCDKQFYKQVYLDAHIRGDHEGHKKPFLCENCQKAFTRYNQLDVHIQTNHNQQPKFVCDYAGCGATFKLNSTLETHRKVVHAVSTNPFSMGLQEVLELHRAELSREIEIDHVCHHCFKNFSSKRALSEHLKRHSNIREHVCKVCGIAKVTRTELKTHMRTHDSNLQKFKCSICPQEFTHKNAITRHIRAVHEGQRRYPCDFCPKRFATRNSKVCHERLHTGERPYKCKLCDKGYAQIDSLKSHMKNHDKSLRTHICSFCAQRFITKRNLVDHEERHRGSKPHICGICSRGFAKPEELVIHSKLHKEKKNDMKKKRNEKKEMKKKR